MQNMHYVLSLRGDTGGAHDDTHSDSGDARRCGDRRNAGDLRNFGFGLHPLLAVVGAAGGDLAY
jgi:hypothetical protein